MTARVLPYGPAALLAELDGPAGVLPLAAALRDEPGVLEVVPAARTVLVRAEPAALARLADRLPELAGPAARSAPAAADGPLVTLDVRYDGPDLAGAAAELGIAPAELAGRHADAEYLVAFCGFAPGFAYLTGLDPRLRLPRLAEPRTRVPAGAVAIADEFSGVYPRRSPGGWRLIGHTDATLWDPDRSPPALLAPGTRVRFRPA